ncbi:hypothetical protein KIN20_024787 [Parelaphostrongylus tenuis]|uniref:Uncharacterized protein n=1 Tax=Parelaphostrongylus tenuis TaxID=148309 RepID=A0AAD5MU13_PARTN|nr:hypothetical protein KIN20_024787 [Parelaphostrongylus tenuis]
MTVLETQCDSGGEWVYLVNYIRDKQWAQKYHKNEPIAVDVLRNTGAMETVIVKIG